METSVSLSSGVKPFAYVPVSAPLAIPHYTKKGKENSVIFEITR